MNKVIKFLIAIICGSLIISAVLTSKVKADDEVCIQAYTIAAEVMEARQAGDSLPSELVKSKGDSVRAAFVRTAYGDWSLMNLQENKDKYVQQFAERAYGACLKGNK